MDQDCIAGVYQCLGLSVGAEFSSEDVSVLYGKVCHVPSDPDEAHSALKKIAGGDIGWSCVGENVFDVLVEMEREREKKEKLYWDLQLINGGHVNTLYEMDTLLQSTNTDTLKKTKSSDTGSLHSCTTVSSQTERLVGNKELCGSGRGVKRLRRAARQCWIRLASEGVQSLLPSPWQAQSLKVKGQAWGWVSLSDVLLLVDEKFDVMSHLLYSEMLQEHHTPSVWKTLLPCQRRSEEEGLEDMAEEALESGDMLRLAELPGAFRMYRACLGASFNSRELCWSAASFLCELHSSRQQEKDKVAVLGERLDGESLKLLCLYIRLATLRARREKLSYRALLAAKQSWDTWPHVPSSCRAEQAALWLREEEEAENEDLISASPQQQAALQLLVLTQEQDRKQLVKLVQGVSPKDLQGPGCTDSQKDGSNTTVLMSGCIKMLRQIHASMQMHNETQPLLEQATSEPQLQTQPQTQTHMCSTAAVCSPNQLEECSLLLLTQLMELHDLQASAFLPLLKNKSAQHLQVLRDEYESELRMQSSTNLLQLLTSDVPSILVSKSCNEQQTAECSSSGAVETQNVSPGSTEVSSAVFVRWADSELNGIQAADVTNTQDACTDCGAVMEEMPYLEIVCVSDAMNKTHLAAEGGCQEEEGGNATKSPQSYEKQGSLITLAWSKPPEEDEVDSDAKAADGGAEMSQDSERIQVLPSDKTPDEQLKPTLFQSGSTESAVEQCSTDGQLTLEERTVVDKPHKGEDAFNLQSHALIAETLQHVQPDLFTGLEPHSDDLCSGPTDETAEADRDGVGVEVRATATESELWDPIEPDPTPTEDPTHDSQFDCGRAERDARRERVREPVSELEREKTIRNLVDMQRKVEQRQQRDRERQMLRVQERLSIIQNRKAEEDLLGLKHTDRLRHLTQDLPQEDKNQQKTVVRERLEQLRRERSYVLQSKRDRQVTLHSYQLR
ncbi:unnamed protein product [Pleuronectes platessa]|uniref:Uncharacterized protein n=1 Tax=Pleuronectes platessa TaxID=8262 RepID=A0A9N7YNU1_PLEPL|nr:unnamed protein product [Pleuronectes platessa]